MATNTLLAPLSTLASDTAKRFDDAIYRTKHNTAVTAQELWSDLTVAQESTGGGLVSGLTCAGILNELKARGQINGW